MKIMVYPQMIEHESWCNKITDDESDYEYLSDAGICTCGAEPEDAA